MDLRITQHSRSSHLLPKEPGFGASANLSLFCRLMDVSIIIRDKTISLLYLLSKMWAPHSRGIACRQYSSVGVGLAPIRIRENELAHRRAALLLISRVGASSTPDEIRSLQRQRVGKRFVACITSIKRWKPIASAIARTR